MTEHKDHTAPKATPQPAVGVDALVRRGMHAAAPPYIYIQECGNCREDCAECYNSFTVGEDVTWCVDKINDADLEYLHLDIVIEMLREAIRHPMGVVPDAVAELFKQNRLSV